MSENNSASDQPGTGVQKLPIPESRSEPNAHEAIPMPVGGDRQGIHNYFLRNLQAERSGDYRPGENSADPVLSPQQGQPPAERRPDARSSDIQQSGGGQPPAEQPARNDQPMSEPAPIAAGQPEGVDAEGLEVDGERFTADRIRDLVAEVEQGTMRLDDYTRKTQMLSRVRQEHEALGTELTDMQESLDRKAAIIQQVVRGNLQAYENANIAGMTQEQHAQFVQAKEQALRGAQALEHAFQQADEKVQQAKNTAFQRISASTKQLLRWHEPRWDNENQFYAKLRKFVINERLMDQEQFDRENDFLRIIGLISLMDRHELPSTIQETRENPRPSERQHNAPQRDSSGRFQTSVQAAQDAVLNSPNARRDGSAREMFRRKLEAERRAGVQPRQG